MVGLSILLPVVGYASKPIFFLCIFLITFLVLREFYELVSCTSSSKIVGIALGLTLTGGFVAFHPVTLVATIAGIGLCSCIYSILPFQKNETGDTDLEKHLVGSLVIAFLFSHVLWLRELREGKLWVFFLLSVAFTGDTFALYGGKRWGRHKLSPRISPGKTVEGTIIGLVGSCLGGVLFSQWFFPGFSIGVAVYLSLILGILAQLGDLWESIVKRKAKVKDSGWLLPGHGGFFDRVDSVLFSAPFLYYFIVLTKRFL